MSHKQRIEFKSRLSLHDRISNPNDDIIRCNSSHDLWNSTERGMARKEMEIMSRCSDDFFVNFVKDGPEFDSEGPIDRWQWKFVHDYEEDGEEEK